MGTILGISQTIAADSIASTTYAWVEFRSNPPVLLVASTKYYIRLRSAPSSTDLGSGSQGTLRWGYKLTSGSGPYSGGEARRFIGKLSNASDQGESLDAYDFGFRVYTLP